MKTLSKFSLAIVLTMASAAAWSQSDDHAAHHTESSTIGQQAEAPTSTDANTAAEMSEGVVRKVDAEQKKITIRHGELKNLDMPPMTMVFQVADPAFVEQVNVGDEVKFVAEKREGKYTVMRIEKKS